MERQSTGFGGYTGKTYTRKNFYLEYIKNSQNSRVRIKTWTKDLNRIFTIEDIQMANKHMKSSKIIMLWGKANKSHNDISPHVLEWPGQRRYQSLPDLGMGTAHTHTKWGLMKVFCILIVGVMT